MVSIRSKQIDIGQSRAPPICIAVSEHRRKEVDVVSSLVHTLMQQYAVISVRTEPRCERLVIAYSDEKTLRNLLAAPSIVALGFRSREEAEASIYRYTTTVQPSSQELMATLVANSTQSVKEFVLSP